jgi:hypothetical protein
MRRSGPIQLSKTAKSISASRADFPPEFSVRVLRCALPKRGSGAPQGALSRVACSDGSTHRSCEDRSRLTALHRGVARNLGPRFPLDPGFALRRREGVRNEPWASSCAGRLVQGLPGPRLRTVGAGSASRSRQFSPADVPQASGNDGVLTVSIKFSQAIFCYSGAQNREQPVPTNDHVSAACR